jgi:hypothetical protein
MVPDTGQGGQSETSFNRWRKDALEAMIVFPSLHVRLGACSLLPVHSGAEARRRVGGADETQTDELVFVWPID